MTDDAPPPGRLDLRSLDAGPDPARADAAIAATMNRLRQRSPGDDDLRELRRYRVALMAAAAVLLAVALASIVARPIPSNDAPSDPLVEWAQSSHVPTNGELLAAYQGYRP
jgi:hypothetical protein